MSTWAGLLFLGQMDTIMMRQLPYRNPVRVVISYASRPFSAICEQKSAADVQRSRLNRHHSPLAVLFRGNPTPFPGMDKKVKKAAPYVLLTLSLGAR
jgi:hypothetical protein